MIEYQKTLLASELLEQLQAIINVYGDKLVYLDDPDTGCLLGIELKTGDKAAYEDTSDCFLITANYHAG